MRLFIAINFEDKAKTQIMDLISELRKFSTQGKFVNAEHMHLTLEFLGEIEEIKLELIKKALDSLSISPFTMELTNIGHFKRREGNIYWLGIKENKALLELQSDLHRPLLEEGFSLEDRPYKPHITLGRKVVLNEEFSPEEFSRYINDININVTSIELMRSDNIKGKLLHTVIYKKSL